ncbi:hypothetical protein ACIPSD_10770 [Pectobacterium sp. CHL-2024]|uniref:hypothetical protein n=1 Tax=Pectobacterium sp. CHL-2024 TaxID=3377079 RepID=UPI003819661C
MKIEYILMQEASSTFCNDEKSVVKLLEFDKEIKFTTPTEFNFSKLSFEIIAKKINSEDIKKSYFSVQLIINKKDSDSLAESMTKLNRKLIKIFEDVFKETPKILVNDLDSYYSTKAYPIIKDIENLMRKVLTTLLITKVGISWEKDSVPAEMKEKISKIKGREVKTNYLSGLDFIDLTIFIFKKYSNHSYENIFSEIEKPNDKIDINQLKNMIPKSNWERYLNDHIEIKQDDILEKWNRLYELRCAIAHNTGFSKKDFDETDKIISEIKPILVSSLDNLEAENNTIETKKPDTQETPQPILQKEEKTNTHDEKNKGHLYYTLKSIQSEKSNPTLELIKEAAILANLNNHHLEIKSTADKLKHEWLKDYNYNRSGIAEIYDLSQCPPSSSEILMDELKKQKTELNMIRETLKNSFSELKKPGEESRNTPGIKDDNDSDDDALEPVI